MSPHPEMHNPTKFFIRIEFKDHHVELIKERSWYAWERDTRDAEEPVEVLIGGARERFLDLVRLERTAKGLDQGNRQLLAERRDMFAGIPVPSSFKDDQDISRAALHPLVEQFRLSADEILDLIAGAKRLKMAVRGWVAEEHLRATLAKTPGVTHCERLDLEGAPDLQVRFQDGPALTIECKNVLRATDRIGRPRLDFQRTRAAKSDPCSRYYAPDDFDVVAACLHAVTEQWEFRYALPNGFPPNAKCPGKLASNIVVGENWMANPAPIFLAAAAAAR